MSAAADIVAVIPARAGSKGVPGKNLRKVGGRSLLQLAIDAAAESGVVSRVIVSTEDEFIAEAARSHGAEVPFLRPQELAEDDVHAVETVFHCLDWLSGQGEPSPRGIMMLLPTSPFRTGLDVRRAVCIFKDTRSDAVIGVTDLGKRPTNLRFVSEGKLCRVFPDSDPNAQRQQSERIFGVNGAIFLARPASLLKYGTFHVPGAAAYEMDLLRSIDVDCQEDLDRAEALCRLFWTQQVV